jgi:hypothetical protein
VWWKISLGIVIALFAVHQMFQDLFHPTQTGALSEWAGRKIYRLFRRFPHLLETAGPLTVFLVIFLWATLLVTGFAFIYWSVFPADFELRGPRQPSTNDAFWWCFYYSLQMLTTLGIGDITPLPDWLRILSAFNTLIGFSLVTASLTWIVLLFPALTRLRALARRSITLADAQSDTGVPVFSPGMHTVLMELAEAVLYARVDLVHFPVLFYFYSGDPRASLSQALLTLLEFADRGQQSSYPELIRLAAASLRTALQQIAEVISDKLDYRDHSCQEVFAHYAAVHEPRPRR